MKMNIKANKEVAIKILKKVGIPLGILALGIIVMVILIKIKPEQKKVERQTPAILVDTMEARLTNTSAMIHATATVSASREITIVPQVSGLVTSVQKEFTAGGFFKKGQLLFTIDETDYALALKSAEAARAKALHTLETVRSRAEIAGQEWEILDNGRGEKPNPLVLYEPQLKEAQAGLASADASVSLAELKLARTKLLAPFDARVRSENIDVGQFISTGAQVARLAGTETAEVIVPLSKEDLNWVTLPTPKAGSKGSTATISISQETASHLWQGQIVRSLGEVDQKSRMISVVVEVTDPYGIKDNNSGTKQLFNGSFVNVSIKGSELIGVFTLPRSVLHEDSTIWVMDEDNSLRIKKVNVLRIEKDRIIINSGLAEGDRIVVTGFSGAAEGLGLRSGADK